MFLFIGIYYFFIGVLELFETAISKKIIAVISIVPAFLLTAFRDVSVGCDTMNYLIFFEKIRLKDSLFDAILSDRMECGYVSISYLFSHLGLSFYHFQLFISAFFYISFYLFLIRYSKNIGISCFVFLTMRYMFGPMNVVRMYLALAILWFSISSVQKHDFIKFSLLVLIASTFHKTAFIFFLLYPLAMMFFSKKNVFLSIFTAGTLSFWGLPFFYLLISVTGLYDSYLERDYFDTSGKIAVYLTFAVDLFLGLFIFYNNKKILFQSQSKNVSIEKVSFSAVLVIICCDIIGFNFSLMNRLSDFYSFCWLILVPMTLMQMKNKIVAIISFILIAICLLTQFETIMLFRPNWNGVEPYSFYFGDFF